MGVKCCGFLSSCHKNILLLMQRRRPTPMSRTVNLKKSPTAKPLGSENRYSESEEKAADIQPTVRPTEYRCYIKEVFLYATAEAETPSWIKSFVHRTLPVPTALNARLPTLFGAIIQQMTEKVNRKYHFMEINPEISRNRIQIDFGPPK